MSHTRLFADTSTPPRRKLLARDACVKNRECTAELAEFLRATAPTVPGTHLEEDQQGQEIATCVECSDPVCEGPSAWLKGETSPAINPIQRCNTESTRFTDITSLTNITKITTPLERTTNDFVSNPYIGKVLRLVSEQLRRVVGTARDPCVSIKSEGWFSSDSSANLSPKGFHDQWMSHTTNITNSILHGAFEIPQQYHLRDKFQSNGLKYVSPGEMGECDNDISLCSHTSTDYHRGSCKMLSLTRRYFTLDNSGRVRQYALTISDEPSAEEVFQTNANSIVVATDAIPGHLWCLRLSNWNIHDAHLQELPSMKDETFAGRERALTIVTKDMLIVFKDPESFTTWMFTIKELVEQHKKRSRSSYLRRQDVFSSLSSPRSNSRPLVTEERWSSYDDENSHLFETKLSRSHYPLDTDFCSPMSRCEATFELEREADKVISMTDDKHTKFDGSSTKSVTELSTIEARLSTTSYDQSFRNTSPQHYQTDHRASPESAIRHSLFELPAESADFTCDDQSADLADIISHSLFERHPSVVEDDSSTCCHLLPSTGIKDLSKSDPKTLFELPPPFYRTKMAESLREREKDLVPCPTMSWRVSEKNSTCRTNTVAVSCPPNSPSNAGGLRSSAGVSTWDFPLPPIHGRNGNGGVSNEIPLESVSPLLRALQEQAPRSSSSSYKKSPNRSVTVKEGPKSPSIIPRRHLHLRRHSHTDSPRRTPCPVLHVSLPLIPQDWLSLPPIEALPPLPHGK